MPTEMSFYIEFADKFREYLQSYIDESCEIYYSSNKTLDNMIDDFEKKSGHKIKSEGEYVPKLKLDIVFAICATRMSRAVRSRLPGSRSPGSRSRSSTPRG